MQHLKTIAVGVLISTLTTALIFRVLPASARAVIIGTK